MKKIYIASVLLSGILFLSVSAVFAYTNITATEAAGLIHAETSLMIVDVREEDEFCDERGHISCAVNYPYNSGQFHKRYEKLLRDAPILLICRSGNRSLQASKYLDSKGYANIYNMLGGMKAWSGETVSCDDPPCMASHLYYPHIASGGGWETEIWLINSNPAQTLSGVLTVYTDGGEAAADPVKIRLAPFARKEIIVGREFAAADRAGYAVFVSDVKSNLFSGGLKFYKEGEFRVAIPAPTDDAADMDEMYLAHIASGQDWWTGVSVLNTADASARMTVEFNTGDSVPLTLAGKEHRSFTIKALFGGSPPENLQSAVIRGADSIVGLELFGSEAASGNHYLSGILLNGNAATSLYFPHMAADGEWWTGIVAYNPSGMMEMITITPFRQDGTVLAAEAISLVLMPAERYTAAFSSLGLPPDTAWLWIRSSEPVSGFELFGTYDGTRLAGYTGVDIAGTEGVFPKLEKDGWTGIAFVNIGGDTAVIRLTAHDDGGRSIAARELRVSPNEKRMGTAEEMFSGSNIAAAAYVHYSSDQKLVAFQLNGSSDGMMLDGQPAQ
ncbi:MAG: hypothetical protein CSB33_03620 [Desulfobacterales bacterium]|nr:MAG: hypothetical protein CSB33_03620 [Desulfobacterales bacterium]